MSHRRPPRGHGDPYRVLGVDAAASQQDIARAYRRAAQRVHPDARPEDPRAVARFRALAAAYDLLRDPRRRAAYDRARPADEPASEPVQPGPAGVSPPSPSPAYLLSPVPGQPLWAGPVHVEPPADPDRPRQGGGLHTARFDDPPVIVDLRPGPRWSWPW